MSASRRKRPQACCLDLRPLCSAHERSALSNTFKCTASEVARPATTDDHTAVLLADFYRAGDGDEASFRAQMIVTDERDLDDDIPGTQNLWVQGVGCGTAIVNFN